MAPTSIDGTDISSATIDGTEVKEITADGDVVYKARNIPNSTTTYTSSGTEDVSNYTGVTEIEVQGVHGSAGSGADTGSGDNGGRIIIEVDVGPYSTLDIYTSYRSGGAGGSTQYATGGDGGDSVAVLGDDTDQLAHAGGGGGGGAYNSYSTRYVTNEYSGGGGGGGGNSSGGTAYTSYSDNGDPGDGSADPDIGGDGGMADNTGVGKGAAGDSESLNSSATILSQHHDGDGPKVVLYHENA